MPLAVPSCLSIICFIRDRQIQHTSRWNQPPWQHVFPTSHIQLHVLLLLSGCVNIIGVASDDINVMYGNTNWDVNLWVCYFTWGWESHDTPSLSLDFQNFLFFCSQSRSDLHVDATSISASSKLPCHRHSEKQLPLQQVNTLQLQERHANRTKQAPNAC